MSIRWYTQFYFTPHKKAVQIDCNFIVDQTNGNGLGQRSLKSSRSCVPQVFMNTNPSATTATSVFAAGVSVITVSSLLNLVVGMVITDSTTSGNITSGTKITAINPVSSQITLSVVTAGASASSPGDTLSFAMTAALAGNPNPQAGIIVVQFADNFNQYFFGSAGFLPALTGTNINVDASDAALTAGDAYVIVSLGTSTAADWVTLGVPIGITPAVGVAFIAAATGAGTGTGKVQLPAAAGANLYNIQPIGDPNTTISSLAGAQMGEPNGTQMILGCYGPTSTSNPTGILKAPANNTVIGMSFVFSSSTTNSTGGG
jgi:hypothetical protein